MTQIVFGFQQQSVRMMSEILEFQKKINLLETVLTNTFKFFPCCFKNKCILLITKKISISVLTVNLTDFVKIKYSSYFRDAR